ncbi:MAG: nucleotidyltransferase family protein [Haloglomus sp.]
MQAVLPAAGRGTRMGPLSEHRPKPLVPVGGTPLLAHALDAVRSVVDEAVIVVGYRGERIRERFGTTYRGLPLTVVEQSERRGLADALARAESVVDGPFVHLNADNVFGTDPGGAANVRRLVERRRETAADAVLLVERVSREAARRVGVVQTDGDGRVRDVVEKPDDPPTRLVQTGCFAFTPRIFDACRAVEPGDTGEVELSDAVARLARAGRVETVRLCGWRRNVNTPFDRAAVEARLAGERARRASSGRLDT